MLDEYFTMWFQLMKRSKIWFTSRDHFDFNTFTALNGLSDLSSGLQTSKKVLHKRMFPDLQLLRQFRVPRIGARLLFNISNRLTLSVYFRSITRKISFLSVIARSSVMFHMLSCALYPPLTSTELCSGDSTSSSKRLLLTVCRLLLRGEDLLGSPTNMFSLPNH